MFKIDCHSVLSYVQQKLLAVFLLKHQPSQILDLSKYVTSASVIVVFLKLFFVYVCKSNKNVKKKKKQPFHGQVSWGVHKNPY